MKLIRTALAYGVYALALPFAALTLAAFMATSGFYLVAFFIEGND